ncbi:MAG: GAF domain-containing protein, partial [Deltaproteobacteria bacterium]|nr:GAF domain-containing protein [Deltaproteobacteria bacterium]
MNNKIEIARLPAEKQVRLARDVLERLNHPEDPQDTIRNILRLIRQATGFEAVGLRLQEGDDFPYFETSGFPRHFVLAERYLCERTEAGGVLRDSRGNPVLECMCGNVIRGRTNPSKPFFTRGGSFWTNCTTELLASTTVEDRKARTRNRCNGEGYESVALIPLRSDGESIGLLQLNDRRRDLFTEEMIQFLEGLGASIGIALARKRADEQVQALNTRLAETEEAERKRFAQVLHDEVGQDLTTLGLNLNLVRDALSGAPPPVLGRFDDSIRLVEGVAGRIRRFMEDLHPAVLEDYGLAAAINWYLDHFAKRT